MLSKNQAKVINSLKHKKFRQKYHLFVAEGIKIIQTVMQKGKYNIKNIYSLNSTQFSNNISSKTQVIPVDERMMKTISFLSTPSKALALIEIPKNGDIQYKKAIYLDGVQDPGNVGTIIRIADWFGIDTVIRSEDSADFYNPKVIQSTMGSFANVQLAEMSRTELLANNRKDIIVADLDGEDLNAVSPPDSFVLVMGSEGKGPSQELLDHNPHKVSISGHTEKSAESLNVSIATGIICAHLCSIKS